MNPSPLLAQISPKNVKKKKDNHLQIQIQEIKTTQERELSSLRKSFDELKLSLQAKNQKATQKCKN